MKTTLSTERLVPLIDALSQNISEILSILKEDAQSAAPAEKKKNTESESQPKTKKEKTPTSPSPEESSTGSSTESKPVITIEQVRSVLAEKSQAGLTSQVKDLLTQFGSVKLSGIDPARYPELIEAAKALQ